MPRISRNELVAALDKVMPGVGKSDNNMQSTCFLFQEGFVYAYNDEVFVSALLPADLEDIECAVQAKPLLTLLKKLKEEEIEFDLDGSHLFIKSGKSKAQIVVELEITMPVDEVEIPKKWKTLPKDFRTALLLCIPIVSKDMSKPLTTCIHMVNDFVEASDVDKAGRYSFSKKVFDEQYYISGTNAAIVCRFDIQEYGVVQEGWMHFLCADDTIVSSRTYYANQPYVEIDSLLEQEGEELLLPSMLCESLERSGIFIQSEDGTELIATDKNVQLTINNNVCTVKGEGSIGRYTENVRIDYDGPMIQFSTKVDTLKDAVARNQRCDVCTNFIKLFDESFTHLVAVSIIEDEVPPKTKKGKVAEMNGKVDY